VSTLTNTIEAALATVFRPMDQGPPTVAQVQAAISALSDLQPANLREASFLADARRDLLRLESIVGPPRPPMP
jgi:hypothetical protein